MNRSVEDTIQLTITTAGCLSPSLVTPAFHIFVLRISVLGPGGWSHLLHLPAELLWPTDVAWAPVVTEVPSGRAGILVFLSWRHFAQSLVEFC